MLAALEIIAWLVYAFSFVKTTVIGVLASLICSSGILKKVYPSNSNSHSPQPTYAIINAGSCRIVEVKGGADKLSDQQRAWIDILITFGFDVDLCLVAYNASDSTNIDL